METWDSGAAERIAQAKAAARRRSGLGNRPGRDDPEALRRSPILWISVIILAILVLSGLIAWQDIRNPPPPEMATPAGVTDDGGRQAGLGAGGTGATTVEVYFDLMCADCRAVHAQTGAILNQLVAMNRIRLVWHPVAVLDGSTSPPGYSTRAANALACAADVGKLREFGTILLADQPAAGSAGLTDDQLIELAGPAGLIQPSFAACVRDQRYRDWVAVVTSAAAQRGIQVPAIVVDGARLPNPTPEALIASVS